MITALIRGQLQWTKKRTQFHSKIVCSGGHCLITHVGKGSSNSIVHMDLTTSTTKNEVTLFRPAFTSFTAWTTFISSTWRLVRLKWVEQVPEVGNQVRKMISNSLTTSQTTNHQSFIPPSSVSAEPVDVSGRIWTFLQASISKRIYHRRSSIYASAREIYWKHLDHSVGITETIESTLEPFLWLTLSTVYIPILISVSRQTSEHSFNQPFLPSSSLVPSLSLPQALLFKSLIIHRE